MNTPSLSRTLRQRFRLMGAAALLAMAAPLLLPKTSAAPLVPPAASNAGGTPVSAGWLNQMRQSGLRGDRSQIPYMVAAFQSPPGIEFADIAYQTRLSLLRPLAHLGATEALPALEEVIQSDPRKPFPGDTSADFWENEQVIALSKVVKARILAQSGAPAAANDKARASAEVKRFFQELGQTPERLNAAVAAYNAQDRQRSEATPHIADARQDPTPVELFAVRELADMAYRDRYKGFMSLPDVARVDFRQDDGAALKVRLAPLTREQRLAVLVGEMSQEAIGNSHALRRAQLLIDEGPSALPVIVAKQQEFKALRVHERGKPGAFFGGLSVLQTAQEDLTTIADATAKSQASGVADEADVVRSQWPRQIAPGY